MKNIFNGVAEFYFFLAFGLHTRVSRIRVTFPLYNQCHNACKCPRGISGHSTNFQYIQRADFDISGNMRVPIRQCKRLECAR